MDLHLTKIAKDVESSHLSEVKNTMQVPKTYCIWLYFKG